MQIPTVSEPIAGGLSSGWQGALVVVQHATVIRWHREGFRLYSRWKSRATCIYWNLPEGTRLWRGGKDFVPFHRPDLEPLA